MGSFCNAIKKEQMNLFPYSEWHRGDGGATQYRLLLCSPQKSQYAERTFTFHTAHTAMKLFRGLNDVMVKKRKNHFSYTVKPSSGTMCLD